MSANHQRKTFQMTWWYCFLVTIVWTHWWTDWKIFIQFTIFLRQDLKLWASLYIFEGFFSTCLHNCTQYQRVSLLQLINHEILALGYEQGAASSQMKKWQGLHSWEILLYQCMNWVTVTSKSEVADDLTDLNFINHVSYKNHVAVW